MIRLLRVLVAAGILAAASAPAHAALELCNRTSYVLETATAALVGKTAEVKGWTRIAPGDCATARKENLKGRAWLVHARSSIAHGGPARAWGGKRLLCVRDDDFALKQPVTKAGCPADGSFPLGFASIDTKGHSDWTMTLDEPDPLPSLQAAQLAGVKRLLRDNGYKTGQLDGVPDKATGAALADFRKKFAPKADNPHLFTILEDRARHHVTPVGLTACNDGKMPLLVALAQVSRGKKVARGWWTVAPGACARLQTVPLAADIMYVRGETRDGATILGGPQIFCIAGAAFEISDAQGRCAERGYDQAGFAKVDTRGAAGAMVRLGGQTGMLK
jgi:uncharacterized membrane protein